MDEKQGLKIFFDSGRAGDPARHHRSAVTPASCDNVIYKLLDRLQAFCLTAFCRLVANASHTL
jgi:hypothetical protein